MVGLATIEKARRTREANKRRKEESRVFHLAEDIRAVIELIPLEDCEANVVKVFRLARGTPEDKADAFRLLDEKPGQFQNYLTGSWYAKLRRCRNHNGHALFETFKMEQE